MKRYEVFSVDSLVQCGLIDERDYQDERGFISFVCETNGKSPIRVVGEDGGEREDQTLYRDWCWVADALNEAYDQGVVAGLRQAFADFPERT